jgi:hypothetical protein
MTEFNENINIHYISDDEEEEEWSGAYHPSFPNEWIANQEPGTGPDECNNCASYGCYQGEFIGYCANCAVYIYGDQIELNTAETRQWPSAYETYLVDVEFARFADEEATDMAIYGQAVVSDDDDDDSIGGPFIAEDDTPLHVHYEGGYADF